MIQVPVVSILLWTLSGLISYYFLSSFIWGSGYAPTSRSEIDRVVQLLRLEEGQVFYVLGSGYGRMIFAIAERYEIKCVGIEADPLKCWWSNTMIQRKSLKGKVSVIRSNFLEVNLQEAERVFVFLSTATDIMEKLRKKLQAEMKPGSLVISYTHRFKNWQPDETSGKLSLYSVPK